MTRTVIRCLVFLTVLLLMITGSRCISSTHYEPTWESLDQRPLPSWYDKAKLGIFIHWGVFSVPSFSSEWFWWKWKGKLTPAVISFMQANYRPGFTYADFAKDFTAEFFDAEQWAKLFKQSGAKYVVFTSKHHEGYTNWPSKYSFNWNSMAVGPKRDIVGELRNAILNHTNLRFGLYHSLFEWFNPLYLSDKTSGFQTQQFVDQKTLPELYEIVKTYKPDIVWSDGQWEASDTYWKSKDFLAWLYNDSPVKTSVVTNDRWGKGISCHHGGFFTCSDRYNPGVLQKHKWENAMTIDKRSWGFRRNAALHEFLSIQEILQTFVMTVSCGGNMLMNVGPPSHGKITPIFEERLQQMGSWLKVNGEGIYRSKPWTYQNDTGTPGVWYTMNNEGEGKFVYAFVFDWPDPTLDLALPKATSGTIVTLLGHDTPLSFNPKQPQGLSIQVPAIPINKMPCDWLWTFKISAVDN